MGEYNDLADCFLTVLTVQMPFELAALSFGSPIDAPFPVTRIVIAQNGKNSVPFSALTLSDQIHVVTTCDAPRPRGSSCAFPGVPVVTHANGSMITRQSPAEPGEVVTIYAWGLGATEPSVETASDNLVEALSLFFECADASEVQRRFQPEVLVTQVEVRVA